MKRSRSFTFQGKSRQEIADYIATVGVHVRCTGCGKVYRHRPPDAAARRRGEMRLPYKSSPCCGARMHVKAWPGWRAWDKRTGREDPRQKRPVLV